MSVWGYGRASTAGQVASPGTQKRIIEEYCRKANLPFQGHFFIDPATSGKINVGDRPAGREMMLGLKRGDAIVVARLDRMCRSIMNLALVMNELENRGVALHIVDF